jgi:hypothetical protein
MTDPLDGHLLTNGEVVFPPRAAGKEFSFNTAYICADTPETYEAGAHAVAFLEATFATPISLIDLVVIYEDGREREVVNALKVALTLEKLIIISSKQFDSEIMSNLLSLFYRGEEISLDLFKRAS